MLKLHLACGDVYLEDGWTNIDIKGELAKDNPSLVEHNKTTLDNYFKRPYVKEILGHDKRGRIVCDVLADVRKLPFDDESADMILNVNLIDHFKFQEVPDLLDEWKRVLKTGGELIIDVGNAYGNAELLINAESDEELEWALRLQYCHSRDPYDSHHWGYTPPYLKKILEDNGFKTEWITDDFIKHVYPAFQICVAK